MPEQPAQCTAGVVLRSKKTLPGVKSSTPDPSNSIDSQQTCSHGQQACSHSPAQQQQPDHIKGLPQEQKSVLAGKARTIVAPAAADNSSSLAQQPVQEPAGQQEQANKHGQLAADLLDLTLPGIIEFASVCTADELREVISQLQHSQLLALQQQLRQRLQQQRPVPVDQEAAEPGLTTAEAAECQVAAAVAAANPAATTSAPLGPTTRMRSKSNTQDATAVVSPAAVDTKASSRQQHKEDQQHQHQQPRCMDLQQQQQKQESMDDVTLPSSSLRARFARLTAEQQAGILLELEQLEEVEAERRERRAKRQAAAAARAQEATAVQQRRSQRHRKPVDLDVGGSAAPTVQWNNTAAAAGAGAPTPADTDAAGELDAGSHRSNNLAAAAAAAASGCKRAASCDAAGRESDAAGLAGQRSSKRACSSRAASVTPELQGGGGAGDGAAEGEDMCSDELAEPEAAEEDGDAAAAAAAAAAVRRLGRRAQARKQLHSRAGRGYACIPQRAPTA